jgi:hypothetical protein
MGMSGQQKHTALGVNMTTIAKRNSYDFYSVIRVEHSTFDDIKRRLETNDLLAKYLIIDEFREEVLVFGSTGFKKERTQF